MHKKGRLITLCFSILAILLLLLQPLSAYVQAAVIAESVIDYNRRGSIYINYEDTVERVDPIVGAEFTAYKIGDIESDGSYRSLIPSIDAFYTDMDMEDVLNKVKEAYEDGVENGAVYHTITTDRGECSMQGMNLGLYIVEESKPAYEHRASVPFFVEMPYTENNQWWYEVSVEPKAIPCGDIVISKTLQGDAADKNQDFHFKIETTDDISEVHYKKSTGEEGIVNNGDSITLKGGQSATLDSILVGESYIVTEVEANKDGYSTTSSNAEGKIRRTTQANVMFINTKTSQVDTGDSYKYLIAGGIAILCVIIAIILIVIAGKKKKKAE